MQISAIFTGVADLRKVFEAARLRRRQGRGTLLFVDEIHRFNKAQQDGFLPHMEDGTILLVGATTENPSFELNAALLVPRAGAWCWSASSPPTSSCSRSGPRPSSAARCRSTAEAREALLEMADGDGRALPEPRRAGAGLEASTAPLDPRQLAQRLTRRAAKYDKSGDAHYNLISALHKSVRGSDPDAALYWLARMLEGGEDPRYPRPPHHPHGGRGHRPRRPAGAGRSAWTPGQTYERLGSPEGELALAQAVVYLALAPKSNAGYVGLQGGAGRGAATPARRAAAKHILNAPTRLMKEQGYGAGYAYDHDADGRLLGAELLPRRA